jgi:HEAT repeat protein
MKNILTTHAALALLLAGVQLVSAAPPEANTNSEPQCLQVLQSDAPLMEKDAACARLKFVGTDRCVPVLSALLTNEQLSHTARYVLESMSSPKAGSALVEALGRTTGLTKVGIITSVGLRHEAGAVPALAKALGDSDVVVARAAATALGDIATPEAVTALQAAVNNPAKPLHNAVVDATLRCANRLLAAREPAKALALFQQLYTAEKEDGVRIAAYRGVLLASGEKATALASDAITGKEGPSQIAALQLVHDPNVPGATAAFAQLLPRVGTTVQVCLIDGLSQRNDPASVPAIAALVSSPAPEVRLAVLKALAFLGDGTVVPLLAESAASATGPEQAAAREALIELHRGQPAEAMLAQLTAAKPAVQAELARALGARSESAAVPKLLDVARQGSDSARKGALLALGQLADQAQLGSLVQLVVASSTDTARAQAAEALNSACQHIQSRRVRVDVAPLVAGLAGTSVEARVALLPICAAFNDPQVRAALQAGIADSNPQIRTAAVRALCDTTDAELLPDLLKLACSAPENNLRSLAVGGCVRLATQEESVKLPNAKRIETLKAILAATPSPEQRRVILAGLGEIADPEALKLAESMLADAAVQNEAACAIVKSAPLLSDSALTIAALKKVLAVVPEGPTRQAAETTLKQLQAGGGFVTLWQVAGPYQQAGRDYASLFDYEFPPERDQPQVAWQALPCGTDPKRPWLMDLLKALGKKNLECVAYARTWIHCDQPQPARLQLGSDDGVKVWLNGKVVHAHNVSRSIKPDSDVVEVNLNSGWNKLRLKITQHNMGWAFCARFLKPDGTPIDGLQFSASDPAQH